MVPRSSVAFFVLMCLAGTACGGSTESGNDADVVDTGTGDRCDVDADCDDGTFCNGAEWCGEAGTCMPGPPPCEAGTRCDEAEARCATDCDVNGDADGDGHMSFDCGGDDCDDTDPNRFPGNTETCDGDGHDEDCDPTTLGPDADGDGFVSDACCNTDETGALKCGRDCDDTRSGVNPGAPDGCGGGDEDCDGAIDEEPGRTYYRDADSDLYGVADDTVEACAPPDGYVATAGDCNDSQASVNPGAEELCDRLDTDCSDGGGERPEEDQDDDGFTDEAYEGCSGGFPKTDCHDEEDRAYPGQTEYFRPTLPPDCPEGVTCYHNWADYNCDGVMEKRWDNLVSHLGCHLYDGSCTGSGWVDEVPDCNGSGEWTECSPSASSSCAPMTETRHQECR